MKNTPIVFIHGLAGSEHNFDYLRPYFKNTISFDLPGFGKSKKPKVTYDKKLFIAAIRERVTEPSVLVGHSLGAMLAKDFALAYPELAKKVFLIGYPLQKTPELLRKKLEKNLTNRIFLKKDIFSRIMCQTKILWKYAILPFLYIFSRKYYNSYRGYFLHTYHSEISTIHDTILKDDPYETEKIKDKAVFITGEYDKFTDKNMLKGFTSYIIKDMGHEFFDHEKEIADVINKKLV